MYELEAFMFVDPVSTARVLGSEERAMNLAQQQSHFATPEHINNGRETAPSKRIIREFPSYQKGRGLNAHLPMVCEKLGLAEIGNACPLFGGWLSNIEKSLNIGPS
jgi:hypothetical protein